MPDRIKNYLVTVSVIVVLLIIIFALISVIFVSILYINIAGGDFSFDILFSDENIYKALLILLVSTVVVIPVYYFVKWRK